MINLQASTVQWVGAPWGGSYPGLGWTCPIPASPAHPLQGTDGCENAFGEGQRNATKVKGRGRRENLWEMALQTRRRGMECPKCQSRDAPAETIAERISCRNFGPRKAHTRAGLAWRTPATARDHAGGQGPSRALLNADEKRGKEQRERVLQSDQVSIPTLYVAWGCRGVWRKRWNEEKSVVLMLVFVSYSQNPLQ